MQGKREVNSWEWGLENGFVMQIFNAKIRFKVEEFIIRVLLVMHRPWEPKFKF